MSDPLDRFTQTDKETRGSDEILLRLRNYFPGTIGEVLYSALVAFRKKSISKIFSHMRIDVVTLQKIQIPDTKIEAVKLGSRYKELKDKSNSIVGDGSFLDLSFYSRPLLNKPAGVMSGSYFLAQYMREHNKSSSDSHVLKTLPDRLIDSLEAKGYRCQHAEVSPVADEAPLVRLEDNSLSTKTLFLVFLNEKEEYKTALLTFCYYPLMAEIVHAQIERISKTPIPPT